MSPPTVVAALAGFDALLARMDVATRQLTADAAHLVQAQSMKEAPVGKPGNSTNAPGDLRRSIDVQGPAGGRGVYEARVGPTVIYGRQRELGGEIYPVHAAALHFWRAGTEIYATRVYQVGNPYMLRGEMRALPMIETVARQRVAAAILGG